ncbi:MAG: hypothetical protein ACR2P4_02845 [Gammaproteobacteria bacterium]
MPGFALQKDVSPLQGFYTAPLLAAMVWEILAFAGMTKRAKMPKKHKDEKNV